MRLSDSLKRYLLDLGERVAKTFAAAVIAAWVASGLDLWSTVTNMAALQKLGIAGLAAAATLLIGIVARWANGHDTVSVFPQLSIDRAAGATVDGSIEKAIVELEKELHDLHPSDAAEATRLEGITRRVSEIDHLLVH